MSTPEEVAPLELRGPYGAAAHVARHPGAAVDVDLAAVVVPARRTAHRLGRVLGPDGVDPAGPPPLVHEPDEVVPHPLPLADAQRAAGSVGVDPVPEEQLGAVDVADPCEHGLVHQQPGDRRPAAADPLPGAAAVSVLAQRVGTGAG